MKNYVKILIAGGFMLAMLVYAVATSTVTENSASFPAITQNGSSVYDLSDNLKKTYDAVVCKGDNASDDAAKARICSYVCESTDSECADEIQDAIDNTPTGGTIFINTGTYVINTTIEIKDRHWIKGSGTDGTTIQLATSGNKHMILFNHTDNVTFFTLEQLTIDGQRNTNTAGDCIHLSTDTGNHLWDARFQDIFVLNCDGMGIYAEDAHHYVFDHVVVEYCDESAIKLDGDNTAPAMIVNSLVKLNSQRGIDLVNGGYSITNNQFIQNGHAGIATGGDEVKITGNLFSENSYGNSGTYSGIRQWSWGKRTTIIGNTFSGGQHKYGIHLEGYNNTVTGNMITNTVTDYWQDDGTGNVWMANQGDMTNYVEKTCYNGNTTCCIFANATGVQTECVG